MLSAPEGLRDAGATFFRSVADEYAISDAAGLALFAVSGTQKALAAGVPPLCTA
jgi:uncharacterized membrane protein YeiH